MDANQNFNKLCKFWGFLDNPRFIENPDSTTNREQKQLLLNARAKLGIDAIYFIKPSSQVSPIPIIYFKKLGAVDASQEKTIKELHHKIWNESKIPLLYVITPTELRIYNCYEPTAMDDSDNERTLLRNISLVTEIETIQNQLEHFSSSEFDSGEFWKKYSDKMIDTNRADRYLLRNLSIIKNLLLEGKLDHNAVHNLIGRSIFLMYLQDRGILGKFLDYFKDGLYKNKEFLDVLGDKRHTYELFQLVQEHFNGDIFPLSTTERSVSTSDLAKIKLFLQGTDLETYQSTFLSLSEVAIFESLS